MNNNPELFYRAQAGDIEARNQITVENRGLVYSVVRRMNRFGIHDEDDLVQVGMMGLMRAVKKFKPELGFQFSTYAYRGVWLAIQRSIVLSRRGPKSAVLISADGMNGVDQLPGKSKSVLDDLTNSTVPMEQVLQLREEIGDLEDRLRSIVQLRMAGNTLEQVAQKFGLTKERIRQLEGKAHRQLAIALLTRRSQA